MMLDEDEERRQWLEPVAWALFLHLLFMAASYFVRLPDYGRFENPAKYSFKLKHVDTSRQVRHQTPRPMRVQALADDIKFGSKQPVDMVEFLRNRPAPLPEDKVSQETQREVIGEKKMELEATPPKDLDTALLETEKRQLIDKVQIRQKSTAVFYQEKAEASAKVSPFTAASLLQSLENPLSRLQLYSPKNVAMDPEEGMPGFTPSDNPALSGGFGSFDYDRGVGEEKGRIAKYESLDEFLDIEVYTYEDPKTAERYFMIKIFAKPGRRPFKVLPKEILFTVDASLSISPERLEEVKRGIRDCLQNLNRDDVFNVLAFKDRTVSFSPVSVPATPESIKRAERFVAGLASNERTDVYDAFRRIVSFPLARRPSNVILISDGRPTHGLVDSREVINSITRVNRKVRPVFAFSGGTRVNRYLLDFISYQNRGWSQYIKNTSDIDKGLAQFYDKIRNPLFLNLRYRLNGLNVNEVFPKSLPDFYAGAEFTLFGSSEHEDTFSMQLLGDVEGRTKELIFSRSLKEAKKGTAEIMRGWAFNKIYYLISRVTAEGKRPELLREIQELSRRYGIATPYSPELEKLD